MGLCLRLCLTSTLLLAANFSPVNSKPTPTAPNSLDQKQADLCELLREGHEDLLNEYPNEYYDCHAHSKFFKLGFAPSVIEGTKAS